MSSSLFLLSIVVCLFIARSSQASFALNDENWDEKVKSQPAWIINLFVPWCEHSKNLQAEWKKLSDSPPSSVAVGHVDCSENDLCESLFLDGFPTIIFIQANRYTEYPGERTSADIKAWISQQKFKEGKSKFVPRISVGESLISEVVILTDRNFDKKVLAPGEPWFIEFYAPWCGHCKSLAPIWEGVAQEMKGIVNIAKVDCTVEKELADRFGIGAYPTIKMIREGKVYEYKGLRNKEEFFAYLDGDWQKQEAEEFPAKEEEFELPAGAESSVVDLTTQNFDSKTSEGVWLIEFFAPWCGHCKQLAPVWEELAYKHSKEFNVAKVDATVETELGDRFEIDGFPMVKLVKDGKMFDYAGPRKIKDYVKFAREGYKKVEPESLHREVFKLPEGESKVVVLTDENFDSQLKSAPKAQWLIEFYAPWCGHCKKLVPTWEELAYKFTSDSLKIAKVDATENTVTAGRFGVQSYPTIFLVRGDKYFLHQGGRKVKDFAEFAKDQAGATPLPLPAANAAPVKKEAEEVKEIESGDSKVVVLTDKNFSESLAKGTWLVKFYAPWCGHCKNLVPTWESLARKHSGSFNVAKLDATVETKTAGMFNVQGYPTLILFKDNKYWTHQGGRDEKELVEFALRGHAKQPGTPIPPPPRQYAEPPEGVSKVVVLTDKNFEATVKKGKWLVEFYAPWCGHCKTLAPIWEQLAYNFDKINVAKLDATVETGVAARFNVQGFPTIKLIYNKQVYDYLGARDIDSLANWASEGYKTSESSPLKGTTKTEKSRVVVLRDSNFDRKISEGTWFVKLYAPWCGHCKAMAPTWDQLSIDVSSFAVADVDATVEKELAKRFDVKGFPTLKLFKDGKMYDYPGDRTYESLRKFGEGGYMDVPGTPIPGLGGKKKSAKRFQDEFL